MLRISLRDWKVGPGFVVTVMRDGVSVMDVVGVER